jgi:hypothetical protein
VFARIRPPRLFCVCIQEKLRLSEVASPAATVTRFSIVYFLRVWTRRDLDLDYIVNNSSCVVSADNTQWKIDITAQIDGLVTQLYIQPRRVDGAWTRQTLSDLKSKGEEAHAGIHLFPLLDRHLSAPRSALYSCLCACSCVSLRVLSQHTCTLQIFDIKAFS